MAKLTPEARATLEVMAVMTMAAREATNLPSDQVTAILAAAIHEALRQRLIVIQVPEPAEHGTVKRLITAPARDRQELGQHLTALQTKFDDENLAGLAWATLEPGPQGHHGWFLLDPVLPQVNFLLGTVGLLYHDFCAQQIESGRDEVDEAET